MHLVRRARESDYEYKYFFVDVKGHQRIYLENSNALPTENNEGKKFKLFGVTWT